jgi:hypothetical protein
MRLILRRAHGSRVLLCAVAVVVLIATALVTALLVTHQHAMETGRRGLIGAAPADERSLLIRGSGGADQAAYRTRDAGIRAQFAAGIAGRPAVVLSARYGTGRQLHGAAPAAAGADGALAFASMVVVHDLPSYGTLLAGQWPRSGATPVQVSLPERVASALHVTAGDRVAATDRATGRRHDVVVAGVWRPRNTDGPYWRLLPGAVRADAGSADNWPFTLAEADFATEFPGASSAAWLVVPQLTGAVGGIVTAGRAMPDAGRRAADRAGLGSSGQVATSMDQLAERLDRAGHAGRSSMLSAGALLLVPYVFALFMLAAALHKGRWREVALLRARGAAVGRLARLAAAEAALLIVPVAVLAPVLAVGVLIAVGRDLLVSPAQLGAVAAGTALACMTAMVVPSLRSRNSYVAELAAWTRPSRRSVVQRGGIDVALLVLTVIAWDQLRRHPASGDSAADVLRAVTPVLAILTGTVLALRLIPTVVRFAERRADRGGRNAMLLGMWQAGRRPHAGALLLLAMTVASTALALSTVGTGQQLLIDRANTEIGADLRLVQRPGAAEHNRADIVGLPGVRSVVPVWRETQQVGPNATSAAVIALDPVAGAGVVRWGGTSAELSPAATLRRMVRQRGDSAAVDLPAGTRQLRGTVSTAQLQPRLPGRATTFALFESADGRTFRLPIANTGNDGSGTAFAVAVPDTGGPALRFLGFGLQAEATGSQSQSFRADLLSITDGAGRELPLPLGDLPWVLVDGASLDLSADTDTDPTSIAATVPRAEASAVDGRMNFVITQRLQAVNVPVVMTSALLRELHLDPGDTSTMTIAGRPVPIVVAAETSALPATGGQRVAALVDLPSLTAYRLRHGGAALTHTEWWVSTVPADHAAAAAGAARLTGVTVLDRMAAAEAARADPFWRGGRLDLLLAGVAAALLALVGVAFDDWSTARQRRCELTVLRALGAAPRWLDRAAIAERALLAGLGVAVGLIVGVGTAAATAPLIVVTPAADQPFPPPAFVLPGGELVVVAVGTVVTAIVLSRLLTARRDAAAGPARGGIDG